MGLFWTIIVISTVAIIITTAISVKRNGNWLVWWAAFFMGFGVHSLFTQFIEWYVWKR